MTLRLSSTQLHPSVPGLDGCMLDAGSVATRSLDLCVPPHPALDLQTPAATVEVWVWPNSLADWPRLLSKYDHILGDEGRVVFRLAKPGVDLHVQSADALPLQRWTRVRCGFDGPGKPIQIWFGDKLSVAQPVPAFNPRVVPVPLALGRYAGGGQPLCPWTAHSLGPPVASRAVPAVRSTRGRSSCLRPPAYPPCAAPAVAPASMQPTLAARVYIAR